MAWILALLVTAVNACGPSHFPNSTGDMTPLARQFRSKLTFLSDCQFQAIGVEFSDGDPLWWWGVPIRDGATEAVPSDCLQGSVLSNRSINGSTDLVTTMSSLSSLGAICVWDPQTQAVVGFLSLFPFRNGVKIVSSPFFMDQCFQLSSDLRLRWNIPNNESEYIEFALEGKLATTEYMALGIADPLARDRFMGGSDAIATGISPDPSGKNVPFVVDAYINGYIKCTGSSPLIGVCDDALWAKEKGVNVSVDNVVIIFAQQLDGLSFIRLNRSLSGDPNFDHPITTKRQTLIWSIGTVDQDNGLNSHGGRLGEDYGILENFTFYAPSPSACSPIAVGTPDTCVRQAGDDFDTYFVHSITLPDSRGGPAVRVFWKVEDQLVTFGCRSLRPGGWASLGIGQQMVGAVTYVAYVDPNQGLLLRTYTWNSQQAEGAVLVDSGPNDELSDVALFTGSAGTLSFRFTRTLAGLTYDGVPIVWAVGENWQHPPVPSNQHSIFSDTPRRINLLSNSTTVDGTPMLLAAHGICMWLVWMGLLPLAIFSARYLQLSDWADNGLWFKFHKVFALGATLTLIAGIACGVAFMPPGSKHFSTTHSILALVPIILFFGQILTGLTRPSANNKVPPTPASHSVIPLDTVGDSPRPATATSAPMLPSLWEQIWGTVHRLNALITMALAFAAIFTGLADAQLKGAGNTSRFTIATAAWLAVFGGCVIVTEVLLKMDRCRKVVSQWLIVGWALVLIILLAVLGSTLKPKPLVVEDPCGVAAENPLSDQIITVPQVNVTPLPPQTYPNRGNVSDIAARFPNCQAFPLVYVGDGWCDRISTFNSPECGYDGGDCCPGSLDELNSNKNNTNLFDCLDPSSPFRFRQSKKGIFPAPRNPRYTSSHPETLRSVATTYNNFYEFGYSKSISAAAMAQVDFFTGPWTITIDGLVTTPLTLDVTDLVKMFHLEERFYAHRCVEAWSISVPWTGFPLAYLLDMVRPLPEAQYIQFQTFFNTNVAADQSDTSWSWPYTEGLTIDEALNEMAFLSVGMYQGILPPENGAPIRLTIPWKYGFKSVKSIVKMSFTTTRPVTFWETAGPREYGFWANVNPAIPHPRWSQAVENVIVSSYGSPVATKIFNGYEAFVGYLYVNITGQDLWH